jgi:hypothetical protein
MSMTLIRLPRLGAALLAVTMLAVTGPARAEDCAFGSACQETARFSATLTDFRVLQTGDANRPLAATLRLRNKTDAPLTLVYVDGSAAAIDDQGHRYRMQNTRRDLRGLGAATRREFDPRFTLGPGEAADTRLEVSSYIKGIHGTRFDLSLAVREVDREAGNAPRLGRETLLRFAGLQDGAGAAAATAPPAAIATPATASPAAEADACQGRPNCVVNGPLAANITRLQAEAVRNNNHGIVVTIAFRNLSDAPMVLNYKQSSGEMLDEHGQRYVVDWRYDAAVQGMPVSTHNRASSAFTLAPGEQRQAQFRYSRYVGRTAIGLRFSPMLAVEQYTLLPSNQLRLEREYALDFGAASAGAQAAGAQDLQRALQSLGEMLKKR